MGRKKIEIKRIDEAKNRQVTFNKRKVGLIKKAIELSILCDCDMIMYVIHNGRVYQYRSTNPEDVLRLVAKTDAYESFSNADLVNGHLRRHKKKRISMSSQSSHSTASQHEQQHIQNSPMFMPTPAVTHAAVAAANAANGHHNMMDMNHRGSTTSLPSPAPLALNAISITKSPMQRMATPQQQYQQQMSTQSPNFHGLSHLQLPTTQPYMQAQAPSPNATLSPSSSSSTVSSASSMSGSSQSMSNGMSSPMYTGYQQSYPPSASPNFSPTPSSSQRRYSNPNVMMPPYDLNSNQFAYPSLQQPTPRHASNPSRTPYQPLASPQNAGYAAPPAKRRRTSSTSTATHAMGSPYMQLHGMDMMSSDLLSQTRRPSLTLQEPAAFEPLDTLSSIATSDTGYSQNGKKRIREDGTQEITTKQEDGQEVHVLELQ